MPILNFISITIRNTRLYRPLQSKIWAFTIYYMARGQKKHWTENEKNEEEEKNPFTKNFFHSKSSARIQPDPITLCLCRFSFASIFRVCEFFPSSIMNGTLKKVTQKVLLKWNLLCSCLICWRWFHLGGAGGTQKSHFSPLTRRHFIHSNSYVRAFFILFFSLFFFISNGSLFLFRSPFHPKRRIYFSYISFVCCQTNDSLVSSFKQIVKLFFLHSNHIVIREREHS